MGGLHPFSSIMNEKNEVTWGDFRYYYRESYVEYTYIFHLRRKTL